MKYENRLRKVAEVTLGFWVITIAATTLGEPASVPKQPGGFNGLLCHCRGLPCKGIHGQITAFG
jgi:hypothetical protein